MQETNSDKTGFIYIKDRRVLGYGTDKWHIPGATRTGTETDKEMIVSGAKTQLGVDLVPETLAVYGVFQVPATQDQPAGPKLTCFTGDFTGELKTSSATETISFISSADKSRMDPTDQLVMDHLKLLDIID